jgi:hypothetical protein
MRNNKPLPFGYFPNGLASLGFNFDAIKRETNMVRHRETPAKFILL